MPYRDIVVVGASAGGVEALRGLVRGLPVSFPGAIFTYGPKATAFFQKSLARQVLKRMETRYAEEAKASQQHAKILRNLLMKNEENAS